MKTMNLKTWKLKTILEPTIKWSQIWRIRSSRKELMISMVSNNKSNSKTRLPSLQPFTITERTQSNPPLLTWKKKAAEKKNSPFNSRAEAKTKWTSQPKRKKRTWNLMNKTMEQRRKLTICHNLQATLLQQQLFQKLEQRWSSWENR